MRKKMTKTRRAFLIFMIPLAFILTTAESCGTTATQVCNNTRPHIVEVDRLEKAIRYENGWTGCKYQHLSGHVVSNHCHVVLVTGEVAPVECGALDTASIDALVEQVDTPTEDTTVIQDE